MKRHTPFFAMAVSVALSSAAATAMPLPKDLQDLAEKWEQLQKKDGAEARLRLQVYETGEESLRHGTLLFDMESARTREGGGNIASSTFETIREDVPATLITRLFPSQQPAPILCEALALKPYAPKKGVTLTPQEIQKAEMQHQAKACKDAVQDTLAGILYGDPKTFVYEVHSDVGTEVVAYVQSMLDGNTYLRYQFQVR